jgi:hypothetical protein
MSARMRIEMVNVRSMREVMLERPPFCKDGVLWREAVARVRDLKRRGVLRGEPFLVATNIYRELGGEFSV